MANPEVAAPIGRSNRLGADRRNTNYTGGNTSAKGSATDPVTAQPVELLWVKGSGGDLGTLKEAGLAVLRLDRLRSLVDVYPGVDREDEMVAAFDFCLHGRGGAAPSIDTPMHGLVDAPHVDHLHPDSGIALATAADGEALTGECFGDRVAWVPWRRPGFQLGLDIAAIRRERPAAIGVILGGHGITAWGETSDACEANSLDIIRTPGVGMFSCGTNAQTARVAGEFYVNAINVMRGAEGLSTYQPIPESEKFRIEYWALEEAKLARLPKPKPLATRIAFVTGAGSGIGRATAHRLAAEGASVFVADMAIAVTVDVIDEDQIGQALREAVLAFGGVDLVVNNAGVSISKPLLDTTVRDWDLQPDVMARGSFLVSREAVRVMVEQGMRGDIVYIASKNSLFAGPNNVAYGAAKADQAHQVRLLAAELGEHGIRVNGINPDGVVRGSGIFAGGWGAQRAAVYGVPEEKLGEFYAKRTLLRREVLPEHVADAVFALVGGDLSQSTGVHIPVDSGVAAAFLR